VTEEWELLRRARAGEESAWQQLTDRIQPQLWKWLLLTCRQPDRAREITQAAWVRLYQAEVRDESGSLRAYLFRIARNLLLKGWQREQRRTELEPDQLTTPDDGPWEELVRAERDRWLLRALASLSPEQREVLELRFFGGHSLAEIAAVLAIPAGTVKSRLHYGLNGCRAFLEQKGVEL